MDGKRLFSWGDLAVPLLVLAILVSVAVIQFDWFRRSAEVEVKSAKNALGERILQVIAREYQRYSSLANELRLAKDLDDSQVGRFLENQFWSFIRESSLGPVIRRIGWTDVNMTSTQIFTEKRPQWVRETYPLPPAFEGGLKNRDLIVLTPPDDFKTLLVGYMNDHHLLLFFEMDLKAFFDGFIRPAVQESLPGYQLELVMDNGQPFADLSEDFNPFSSLWSAEKGELFLPLPPVPDFLQPPRFFQDRRIDEKKLPGQGEGFRGPNPGPGERPGFHHQHLHITLPDGALIHSVEQRLAWIWLFTMILMVLVASVFLINFHQALRMRQIARKEREFVAGVTHELRTPLTVIQSAADNLTLGIVGQEKISIYGQTIKDQAVRLGRMVEEMLLFAQVESQASTPGQVQEFLLSDLVKALKEPLDLVAHKEGKNLVWDLQYNGDPLLHLDRDGLELMVKNLVMNALSHAYQGGGEIRVQFAPAFSETGEVFQVIVEDDGRGIAAKDQKAVFEPFFRDEVSRNRQERGSGLGLFLVKKKVHAMGGQLKLESPYKRDNVNRRSGCRFTIKLPAYGKVPKK